MRFATVGHFGIASQSQASSAACSLGVHVGAANEASRVDVIDTLTSLHEEMKGTPAFKLLVQRSSFLVDRVTIDFDEATQNC
ncbi:unnamed protein product [Protopolystoma xenopodis]|uniref:Uncharacterized protein n=1 Tax=Protopolystoma xenopodis TaxID=117903 RepID=A0A448XCP7_9PLAT|nr:unnamed protein product [Protopolystoma xenopodis]